MTAPGAHGALIDHLDGAQGPDDLTRPLYGAGFGAASKRFFRRYAAFTGRSSRSEYWWVQLLVALLHLVPAVLTFAGFIPAVVWSATNSEQFVVGDELVEVSPGVVEAPTGFVVLMALGAILWFVVWAALIVPSLALTWRRLHDANLPGPLWFLSLVPSVGGIILLVLALLPSKPEGRRFDARGPLPA